MTKKHDYNSIVLPSDTYHALSPEEQLWNRFTKVQRDVEQLKYILQPCLPKKVISVEDRNSWLDASNTTLSHLGQLILDTYSFVELNNDKDI